MKFKSMLQVAVLGGAAIAASAALANGYDYKVAPAAPSTSYNGAGFVLGIQGGYANTHWDNLDPASNDALNVLRALGIPTPTGSFDTKDTGFAARGYVGYDFNNYFGAELGYLYLPKAKVQLAGTNIISIKNYAVDLLGRLSVPIANGFSVYAKAGAAYLHSTDSVDIGSTSPSESESHVGPAFGVGAAYAITPQLSADLSWTRYSGNGKTDTDYQPSPDVFLLGLSYKFPVNWS